VGNKIRTVLAVPHNGSRLYCHYSQSTITHT